MPNRRLGCTYCFRTLDSQDEQAELRDFIRCDLCGALYHSWCWQETGQCLNWNRRQAKSIRLPPPPPLKPELKRRALSASSSNVMYVQEKDGTRYTYSPLPWRKRLQRLNQIVRALIPALVLIGLASLVGAFTYRILTLDDFAAEELMDAIFKRPIPGLTTLASAFIGATVSALVFYIPAEARRKIAFLLGGMVAIAGIDLVLFDWTIKECIELDVNLPLRVEALSAQGAAFLVAGVLTPLHRKIAPVDPRPDTGRLPLVDNLVGWGRLIPVVLLIGFAVVYFSTYRLPTSLNTPQLYDISLGSIDIPVTRSMLGAFFAFLGVASVAYWPPKAREVSQHFATVRLILAALSLAGVGLLYRGAVDPQSFIHTAIASSLIAIVALPLQRALS